MEKLTPITDIKEIAGESHLPALIAFADRMSSLGVCLTPKQIEDIRNLFNSMKNMHLKDQLRFLFTTESDLISIQKTTHSKCADCLSHGNCEMEKAL